MTTSLVRSPAATRHRRWSLIGAFTLVSYNTWVLWLPVNGHPGILNGYLSELSAGDQPHDWFFRGGDLVTALLVTALAVGWLRRWRRGWPLVTGAALLLFGVATALDAFLGMDCSPTLSEACRLAEETGRLSPGHYAHTVTSVSAQAGIVASMTAGYVTLWRRRGSVRTSQRLRRLVLVLAVSEVVALTVMMVLLGLGLPGLGYPQAAMVVIASLWFALVGVRLDASARAGAGRTGGRDGRDD